MRNTPEWELYVENTFKIKVDGGYIYTAADESWAVFVPDTQSHQESKDAPDEPDLNEMSQHINDLYSRISESEKKIKSLHKYISDCDKGRFDADEVLRKNHNALIERVNNVEGKMLEKYCVANERIEYLEDKVPLWDMHKVINELSDRVKKLEQEKTIYKSNMIDCMFKRIEKLESLIGHSNDQLFHYEIVQHEHRIKKLESICEKQQECDHDWMDNILLSNPPQMICKKCKLHAAVGSIKPTWLPGESPLPKMQCLHSWASNDNPREEKCLWCAQVRTTQD